MSAADESRVPAARRLHGWMAGIHSCTACAVAKWCQKQFADACRSEVEYAFGDQVSLSTRNICLRIAQGKYAYAEFY